MTKLLDIYSSILKFSGFDVDNEGLVSSVIGEKKEPAFIDGARIVLPTDTHLRNYVKGEKVIFHPLTENILRGESDVIQKLKTAINLKLNYTIGIIGQNLLNLLASPELHHRLNPEQLDIMKCITECDEKSRVNFVSYMLSGYKTKSDRLYVNIYLKRGGNVNDKRFARVGIVSFPFYDELMKGKVDKLRVKDVETFKQLFKFIFPDIDNVDHYNHGSNSSVAPFLDSLMRTASNIASRLNDVTQQYKEFIDGAEEIEFDSEWMDTFDDLESLTSEIRRIPVQQGNEGSIGVETPKTEIPRPTPIQQQQQPVVYQAPAPYQQPQQQQIIQPQKPEVKVTSGGISFNSLVNARPDLAMNPNPLMPAPMMMNPGQIRAEPSWARPNYPQNVPMGMMGGGMYPNQVPQGMMMQQPMQQQPISIVSGPMLNQADGMYYYQLSNGQYINMMTARQMFPQLAV